MVGEAAEEADTLRDAVEMLESLFDPLNEGQQVNGVGWRWLALGGVGWRAVGWR